MVQQARLERQEAGVAPVTEGWFVVSIPEAAWWTNEAMGAACVFESEETVYARYEVALRHGAGVEADTRSSAEAYARFPKWRLGPPASWEGLPWA